MAEVAKKDFLVSIRPPYARKIIEGVKSVELRRRFADEVESGSILLIYSTSPVQAIVGYATIREVCKLPIRELWHRFGSDACVPRDRFYDYFRGLDEGYAISLGDVHRFVRNVTASALRKKFGFIPPQSYMYLPMQYYSLLKNERLQASD